MTERVKNSIIFSKLSAGVQEMRRRETVSAVYKIRIDGQLSRLGKKERKKGVKRGPYKRRPTRDSLFRDGDSPLHGGMDFFPMSPIAQPNMYHVPQPVHQQQAPPQQHSTSSLSFTSLEALGLPPLTFNSSSSSSSASGTRPSSLCIQPSSNSVATGANMKSSNGSQGTGQTGGYAGNTPHQLNDLGLSPAAVIPNQMFDFSENGVVGSDDLFNWPAEPQMMSNFELFNESDEAELLFDQMYV